jgi:flagellar hook-length control protein FliK
LSAVASETDPAGLKTTSDSKTDAPDQDASDQDAAVLALVVAGQLLFSAVPLLNTSASDGSSDLNSAAIEAAGGPMQDNLMTGSPGTGVPGSVMGSADFARLSGSLSEPGTAPSGFLGTEQQSDLQTGDSSVVAPVSLSGNQHESAVTATKQGVDAAESASLSASLPETLTASLPSDEAHQSQSADPVATGTAIADPVAGPATDLQTSPSPESHRITDKSQNESGSLVVSGLAPELSSRQTTASSGQKFERRSVVEAAAQGTPPAAATADVASMVPDMSFGFLDSGESGSQAMPRERAGDSVPSEQRNEAQMSGNGTPGGGGEASLTALTAGGMGLSHSSGAGAGPSHVSLFSSHTVDHLAATVTDQSQTMMDGETRTVQMRVEPPELGEMLITIHRNSAGQLDVSISASQPDTQFLLQQHTPEIVQALGDQGVNVSQFDLSQGQAGSHDSGSQQQQAELNQLKAELRNGTARPSEPVQGSGTVSFRA